MYVDHVAWSTQRQTVADLSEKFDSIIRAIEAISPEPIRWHCSGSRAPWSFDSSDVEAAVGDGVWQDDSPGGAVATRGYNIAVVAWRHNDLSFKDGCAVSLGFHVGNQEGVEGGPWPNRSDMTFGGELSDPPTCRFARDILTILAREWPAEWARVRSSDMLRCLERAFQPDTGTGLLIWIGHDHAPVSARLPRATRTELGNGVLVIIDDAEAALVDAAKVLTLDAALTASGSLFPIPATRS